MGICYTYLLYDDFDWAYQDRTKAETIEALKKELPVAEILAQWYYYIVVDLGKHSPWRDSTQLLKKYCDSAWYYGDSAGWDLQEVEFKPDPVDIEKEKLEHRNTKQADIAFEEWKKVNVPVIRKEYDATVSN